MAINKTNMVDIELENGSMFRSFLNKPIGTGDALADRFGVRVFRNRQPVDLTGVSVSAFFKDPQGTNIYISSGEVSGNEAYVTLPAACYNYEGQFTLAIKLTGGEVTGTMRIVDGTVCDTNTNNPVVPTGTVPPFEEVLAMYEEVIEMLQDQFIFYPFAFHLNNYISKTTGQMVEYTATSGLYSASTWIPVQSKHMVLYGCNTGDDGGIAFYDKDFHFLSGDTGYASWAGNAVYEFDVPDKARYLRFTQLTTYQGTCYLKGLLTVGFDLSDAAAQYSEIPWMKDYAYSTTGDGSISAAPGAKGSDILLIRDTEKYLQNWDRDTTYFYMNLFNKDRQFVGTKRYDGYYNPSGEKVNSIDYYSYALSVSQPYSWYAERSIYLDRPLIEKTEIKAASVAALETALIEAYDHANPTHEYHITIAEGTYDVWAGLDKTRLGTYSQSAGDLVGKRGLELPGYTHLYGEGTCILDLELPSDQRADYSMVVSTLNLDGCEASIHNITFIAYDCRYTIHDDSRELETGQVLWDRCHFKFKGNRDATYHDVAYCYGGGFFGKRKAIFRNCVFEGGDGTGAWAGIFVHNHQTAKMPFSVVAENCAFLKAGSAILMNVFYDYGDNFTVTVNNSYFAENSDIDLKGAGGGYLYGGGNTAVTVNDTATTPTVNYMVT